MIARGYALHSVCLQFSPFTGKNFGAYIFVSGLYRLDGHIPQGQTPRSREMSVGNNEQPRHSVCPQHSFYVITLKVLDDGMG